MAIKQNFIWVVLFFFCFLTDYTPIAVSAEDDVEKEEIRFVYTDIPPLIYTNDQGEAAGPIFELLSKVMEKTGYRWKAYHRPQGRLMHEIIKGKYNLWVGFEKSLNVVPDLKSEVLMSRNIIHAMNINVYWVGDTKPIEKMEDLRGKKLITILGYTYAGWTNFIRDPANNISECHASQFRNLVLMLKYGRCDYLINYEDPMREIIREIPISDLKYKNVAHHDLRFMFDKRIEGGQEIMENIDKAYEALKDEGLLPIR